MAGFKVAMLEVYNLDKSVSILVMKRELKTSRLTYSFDKKLLRTYLELLFHTQKYIYIEEADCTQRELDERPRKRQARGEHSELRA